MNLFWRLRFRGDFTAIHGGQIAIGLGSDRVTDESNRAVRERKLQPRRVPAAERIEKRPIVVGIVESAVVGLFVPIGGNGRRTADTVGIGPGTVRADRRNILAEHEGVAS